MNKKTKKIKSQNKRIEKKQSLLADKPILRVSIKAFIIVFIIGAIIKYSDYKGYFNPDETNNHTKRKWDSFYDFTEENNVDILLLGNSHLYTGINPKNLSTTLGVNAFILASPGTNISNTYFGLKEALKRTDPKLVVIETFGIHDFNPYKLEKGPLSDQIKSFNARKDFITKITSTPYLFDSDNYFYAWSNTIRNHDFIFKDPEQLAKNKKLMSKKKTKKKALYLGRYVRFQKGLQKDILSKYESLGAPVDGNEYTYNSYTQKYVEKIVDLCKEKNIELIFLTLPMYYKHIKNYENWNEKIGQILNQYPNKWLNLQNPYDKKDFTEMCFENTYKSNQHMTYQGSLIATYKLADFIKSNLKTKLPDRKGNRFWKKMFYGQEGYFENNSVAKNDSRNKLLSENFRTNNITLKEVSLIKENRNTLLIAKIDKKSINNISFRNCQLRLEFNFIDNNTLKSSSIGLQYDILHEMPENAIFKAYLKPINIKKILNGQLYCE